MSDSWSALALRSCLEHLAVSTVTEGRLVSVEWSWTDGPDAFCVVYRPPFDSQRRVGLRRYRLDAIESGKYELGDMVPSYDVGSPLDPDPVWFGRAVADFDIGEPMGNLINVLRVDDEGVGWWGSLGDVLPSHAT
jgi:hypothetical protein